MGMAASQARLIEITARKNNVEYEGQQINQQRTNLANESAGLFNQLLTLEVPTPPSTSDYTTTQYTFNDGTHECTITDIGAINNAQYNYNIKYYYSENVYTGVRQTKGTMTSSTKIDPDTGDTVQYLGTTKLTAYNATDDLTAVNQIIADTSTVANPTNFHQDFLDDPTGRIFKYKSGGQTYYVGLTDLTAIRTPTVGPIDTYYAADLAQKQNVQTNAYLQKEDSGRFSSVQPEGYSNSFDLNAQSVTDENAYNDAMNEYTYQQQVYQQHVQSINAKTEVIQQEDRTLELKLKQLDTEQEALQTELEAVKKVIDKNIEQTFKTFS